MGKSDKQVFVPEGSVGAYVKFNALITPRTKLNVNDVEEMRRRWLNYVNLSDQYNIPLGNKNAQTALGLSWQQINDFPKYPVSSYLPSALCSVCFIPGLYLRIRRWLPAASTEPLGHSQHGAPSRPLA